MLLALEQRGLRERRQSVKLYCLERTNSTVLYERAIASEPRSGIAFSSSFDIGTKADAGKDSQLASVWPCETLCFNAENNFKYVWYEEACDDPDFITTTCRTVSLRISGGTPLQSISFLASPVRHAVCLSRTSTDSALLPFPGLGRQECGEGASEDRRM